LGTYYPSHDLVAVAFLQSLDLPADGIDTDLPRDPADWTNQGFIQVTAVGGSPEIDVPVYRPAVQVDVWANRPGSEYPPWNQAGHLAAALVAATYDTDNFGISPTLPDGFRTVRVLTAFPLSEPRRILDDPAGFARVSLDLALRWVYTA
jgi:hypothetical protein